MGFVDNNYLDNNFITVSVQNMLVLANERFTQSDSVQKRLAFISDYPLIRRQVHSKVWEQIGYRRP